MSGSAPRRRPIVVGLLVALVALVLLAIPLLSVFGEARAAERQLTAALSSLQDEDVAAARKSVATAREHVDEAQGGAQGIGGDVWSRIPVVGTPVADARNLVQALDDATAIAEIGVDLYPSVAGKRATLFDDKQVDPDTLDEVIAGAREAGEHLASADSALSEVRGTTPFVGDTISAKRDAAAARLTPMVEAFSDLEPMLEELPKVLGFEGRQRYLIAMLNPAELRYSGGAALSFASMSWDQGRLDLGGAFTLDDDPRLRDSHTWPKVRRNPFHRTNTVLANSTFAPSWSISGKEFLRAWRSAMGVRYDGVLAVDVVTTSRLLDVTGPVAVPGLGELNSGNVVETLIGSYDDYYPDATAQDRINAAIVTSLQEKLFTGGKYFAKARALKDAADGRHLALYFQDHDVQSGFATLGMDGDLTKPVGDYLGVFTQSLVGSKVDYWQRRRIALKVALDRDGSATNQLDVVLHNDTPPFVAPWPDPRDGYFTRWSNLSAAVFLPRHAQVESMSLGGKPWDGKVRRFYAHTFASQQTVIPPGRSTSVEATYTVPEAADVDDAGNLTYRLAVDPQGMAFPASAEVTVHVPDGYRAAALPEGWSAEGSTLTFRTEALDSSHEWEITLETDS